MKIKNLGILQTKQKTKVDLTKEKPRALGHVDEFKPKDVHDLARFFSGGRPVLKDWVIDISSAATIGTETAWWSDQLLSLLPPIPEDNFFGFGQHPIAKDGIFNILKSIGGDKSYLKINLRDDFKG